MLDSITHLNSVEVGPNLVDPLATGKSHIEEHPINPTFSNSKVYYHHHQSSHAMPCHAQAL